MREFVLKGVWAVPVVFGIALMLGVSSVPAFADPSVLVCFFHEPDLRKFLCTAQPNTGDHILVIVPNFLACHADVGYVLGSEFSFRLSDHPRCMGLDGLILIASFSVVGN